MNHPDFVDLSNIQVPLSFWHKVEVGLPGDCWEWKGSRNKKGYGRVKASPGTWGTPKSMYLFSHRVSYYDFWGHVSPELTIDHRCRNTLCVNPHHLDSVSLEENLSRRAGITFKNKRTHCKRGHEYSPQNTGYFKSGKYEGHRRCKSCIRYHNQKKGITP